MRPKAYHNHKNYCRFHREPGHDTDDCHQLKRATAVLDHNIHGLQTILAGPFGGLDRLVEQHAAKASAEREHLDLRQDGAFVGIRLPLRRLDSGGLW